MPPPTWYSVMQRFHRSTPKACTVDEARTCKAWLGRSYQQSTCCRTDPGLGWVACVIRLAKIAIAFCCTFITAYRSSVTGDHGSHDRQLSSHWRVRIQSYRLRPCRFSDCGPAPSSTTSSTASCFGSMIVMQGASEVSVLSNSILPSRPYRNPNSPRPHLLPRLGCILSCPFISFDVRSVPQQRLHLPIHAQHLARTIWTCFCL